MYKKKYCELQVALKSPRNSTLFPSRSSQKHLEDFFFQLQFTSASFWLNGKICFGIKKVPDTDLQISDGLETFTVVFAATICKNVDSLGRNMHRLPSDKMLIYKWGTKKVTDSTGPAHVRRSRYQDIKCSRSSVISGYSWGFCIPDVYYVRHESTVGEHPTWQVHEKSPTMYGFFLLLRSRPGQRSVRVSSPC